MSGRWNAGKVVLAFLLLAPLSFCARATMEERGQAPVISPALIERGFVPYRKRWALIVGIDKYPGAPDLSYAAADARAIRDLLLDHLGFDDAILLLNEEAKRADILEAIVSLRESTHPGDQVFFYFSGHGVSFGDGSAQIGYLVPQDIAGMDEPAVAVGGISMSDLSDRLVKLPAKHVLLAVDACYSGLAATVPKQLSPAAANYLRIITTSRARQILTAGKRGETVVESAAWGHSAFAYKLLQGLRTGVADGNGDHLVIARELHTYLSAAVSELTAGRQTPQFERLEPEEGEFVFILPQAMRPGPEGQAEVGPGQQSPDATPRQPFRLTISEDYLEVYDERRELLWSKRLSGRIARGELADLDADGSVEVVIGMAKGGRDTGLLIAYDAAGERLWSTDTTATFNYAGGGSGRLLISDLALADLFATGKRQIVTLSKDEQGWYQSRLTVVDADGEAIGSYWHPGHLTHLAIAAEAPGERPRIIVAGINNDLGRYLPGTGYPRSLFMLDPRDVAGEAPPYYGREGRGSHLWYSLIVPKETPIGRLEIVDRDGDGQNEISVWTATGQVFYLDFEGNPIGRAATDGVRGRASYRRIEPED